MPAGSVATRLRRADSLLQQALQKLEEQDLSRLTSGAGPLPAWAAPGRRQAGVSVVSRAEATVRRGPWLFVNNQWARARVRGPFDQCLLFRGSGCTPAGAGAGRGGPGCPSPFHRPSMAGRRGARPAPPTRASDPNHQALELAPRLRCAHERARRVHPAARHLSRRRAPLHARGHAARDRHRADRHPRPPG